MLAFVFWHWPDETTSADEYERGLAAFHGALADAHLEGFRSSASFRVERAPWSALRGSPAFSPYPPPEATGLLYEDWYLVDGFAALEPLNVGAVSTGPKPLHDHVAYASAGGAGGVYRLVSGTEQIKALTWAAWLSKPKGTRVADFSAALTPWIASGEVSLWRRQLVLGPAPEFCLTSAGGVELPPALPVLQTRRSQIWPAETR